MISFIPVLPKQAHRAYGRPNVAPDAGRKCGAKMTLARIEPDKPGYDLRAFECTKCNNVDQYIVEYETSSPWVLVVRGS
jgi:hypothetical protein